MLESELAQHLRMAFDDDREADTFLLRLERYSPLLFDHLTNLYQQHTSTLLDQLLAVMVHAFHQRPPDLRRRDEIKLLRPDWWQQPDQLAYRTYVEQFAGHLNQIPTHLPYLQDLGVTHLHLLGIFPDQAGEVTCFRHLKTEVGTLNDLGLLARHAHTHNISLGVTLPLHQLAPHHEWFEHPQKQHFLTEFSTLDWEQPDLLKEYLELLCQLANRGIELIGLQVENHTSQQQPHLIHVVGALQAALSVVAPATHLLAEVPTLSSYMLGSGGNTEACTLAVHPYCKTQLWAALANKDTRLLQAALNDMPTKPTHASWNISISNELEITWEIPNSHAKRIGSTQATQVKQLSGYYNGDFAISMARGFPYQRDPSSQVESTVGTAASLAGLEVAQEVADDDTIHLAILRLRLLNTFMLGFGGLPMLFMGDELALCNAEIDCPDLCWIQRPHMPWPLAHAAQHDTLLPAGLMRAWIQKLIQIRQKTPQLHASVESIPLNTPDSRVILLQRSHHLGCLLQVYNFSDEEVILPSDLFVELLGQQATDQLSGQIITCGRPIRVESYDALWLF